MSLINGPLNVVRLEGKINKIKKVIYVFFDIHVDVNNQTKCDNFDSIDIANYLAREFKTLDKEIDFFMEGRTSELDLFLKDINFKDKYISEVIKFFAQNFKKNNFDNVRFHYIDIRDFFTDQIDKINNMNNILLDNLSPSNFQSIDQLKLNFKTIQEYHDQIIEMIKNNGNNSNKVNSNKVNHINGEINKVNHINGDTNKGMPKYIKKLSDKYINKEVKEKMLMFRYIIIEKLEKQNKIIDEIIDVLNKYYKVASTSFDEFGRKKIIDLVDNTNKLPTYFMDEVPYMREFTDLYKKLSYENLQTFSLLMDSYFMRRFCDKDYILNAISYTGSAHSMAYVNFLCNQFDFEITHVAKSSEPIDVINKKLKAKFDYIGFAKYFFPKTLSQCVDLSDFPKNFD
jgi:hypothetical protein